MASRLTELGHQLATSGDLAQAADLIASAILRITGVARVVLEKTDPASGALVCIAAVGDVPPGLVGTARPADEGVAGLAVRGAMPVWSRAPRRDRRIRTSAASRRVEGDRSVIVAPLLSNGKVTGTVVIGAAVSRSVSEADLWRFLAIADQTALVLENVRLHEVLEARARRLEALARLAQVVSRSLERDQVLGTIARAATELTGAAFCAVWLTDDSGELRLGAASDPRRSETLEGLRLAPGEGLVGWVAAHGRILEVADVLADERVVDPEWWRAAGLRSFVGAPIVIDGVLAGVLALCAEVPFRLEPDDRVVLESFAAGSAVAIRNARQYEEAERGRQEAEVMTGLLREMAASLNLDAVLSHVVEAARLLCRCDVARVALREPSGDGMVFRSRYWVGARTRAYEGLHVRPGEGAGGLVLQSGRPFRTDDYLSDPRISRTFDAVAIAEGHVSELVVPIRMGDHIDGLLYVNRRERRAFTDRDEAVLLRLADHAAIAISNAQAFERASAAAAEAEAARRRWHDLVQSLDAVVWEATSASGEDPAGGRRFSFVSERAQGLVGHPVSRWLEDPSFWLSLVHPDDLEHVQREWARAVREGGDLLLEYRLVAADGREVWVRDAARAIPGADGAVRSWRGVVVDVTSEREVARALRESEGRFHRAFEDGPVGMALLDRDGRWIHVNRALCAMTGHGPRELVELGIDGVAHPDDLAGERAERQRLLAGEVDSVRRTMRYVHRAGHVIWVDAATTALRGAAGELRGAAMQVRDVTAEKWAARRLATLLAIEEALAESLTVTDAIPRLLDAIRRGVGWELAEWWRRDRDAQVLRWDAMVCVPDFDPTEFERVSRALTLAPGQGLPGRAWANGRPEWMENTAVDAGFVRAALVTSVGLRAAVACPVRADGEVIGVMAFFSRDVYRPDPDLLALMDDVDRRVGRLASQRRAEDAARREAERRGRDQATETVRELVGTVAASIGQALSVAAAQAERLPLREETDEPGQHAFETLQEAIVAVGDAVADLIAFAGARAMTPRPVDLNAYLRMSRERLGRRCGQDVSLDLLLDESLPPVWADPEGLGALVDCLVAQGLAAMPGGGHLTLETARESEQGPGSGVAGGGIVLAVHDTGVPMDPSGMPRTVEPGLWPQRLSPPLAAAWGLVRQQGGRIVIQSDPHGGNTVRVHLRPAVEVVGEGKYPDSAPTS